MKNQNHKQLLEQYSAQTLIDIFEPYISESRQERIQTVLNGRLNDIHLAIECPSDINNALAAIRTAEALGVNTVHIIRPEGSAYSGQTITQGAIFWVNVEYHTSLEDFLKRANILGLQLAGGAVTATQPLSAVPTDKPLCIMVGNEQRGLTEKAINACQHPYKIPMYGFSESMNLSVSAAISLYDVTTRKRQDIQAEGDLTSDEQTSLKAQYYLNSLSTRLINGLLNRQKR